MLSFSYLFTPLAMKVDKIFLAGLPGTGKTEFGKFLFEKYGFSHFDLEENNWPQSELREIWNQSRGDFIAKLKSKKTILNWGFPASYSNWVKEILDNGFSFIWFTGKEECARKWFLKKKNDPLIENFDAQVHLIRQNDLPRSLGYPFIQVNVFEDDCEFKSYEEILRLIKGDSK